MVGSLYAAVACFPERYAVVASGPLPFPPPPAHTHRLRRIWALVLVVTRGEVLPAEILVRSVSRLG